MTISTASQTIALTGVERIVITEIEESDGGGFVREVRVFGATLSDATPPFFVLRMSGVDAADIKVIAPEQEF